MFSARIKFDKYYDDNFIREHRERISEVDIARVTKSSNTFRSGCEISVRRIAAIFPASSMSDRVVFARAREIKMDTLTGQSGCRRDGELWPVISGLHGKFVRRQRGYNRTVRSRFGKGWNICTTEFRGRETPNEKVVGKGASERERQKEQWTPLLKSAAAKRRCDERKSDSTVADKISRKCAKHIIQSFPGIFLYRAR